VNDIIEQLASYEAHFDRAIERRSVSRTASDLPLIVSTEEGDMIVMDGPDVEINDETGGESVRSPWMLKALAAAALVLVVVGALYVVTGDEKITSDGTASPSETNAASTPASVTPAALTPDEVAAIAVIEAYGDAYNSGDLDAVMDLFGEDSTIVGHPFGATRDGLVSIRALHDADMNAAAVSDAYAFSNFRVEGNTVTWDHRWTNAADTEYCAVGNSAEVEDGVITSWTWSATGPALCSRRSAVIEEFASAFNSGDIDQVMAVFGEGSIITKRGVAPSEGLEPIRSGFADELAQEGGNDLYFISTYEAVSNFDVVGNTVIWDDRWVNSKGDAFCGVGHSAVVENGVIVAWDWGDTGWCDRRSAVIEAFVVAYNKGNLDGVLERFREDSVVVGHPFSSRAIGLSTIGRVFAMDIAAAAETDPLSISNVEVVGTTVTWDHRWTNGAGEIWCVEGHSAVVENGAIISWTWAHPMPCE